ncbi:DNA-binding transcriptional LysR family regulator [Skermanella aerolata]|uniref:LysR family transcriptional regulator n=1 Tax=Skermanella aerolata TaxID=393310 RepID=UPI003D1F50BD
MDLSDLHIFRTVATECSVTRASQTLARVPSNVTTRVQRLEQDLGVPLFSRDGKRMTLTREGLAFLPYASRILDLVAEARQVVNPTEPSGLFRVGTMESTAASRLPDLLARFHALWPSVSLQLTLGATRDLTQGVLAHRLDCALIARPMKGLGDEEAGFDPDQLQTEHVFVENLLIVLPPDHPEILSPADLRVDTLAALEPGCTYRRIAEKWARGGKPVRTLELNSYHAVLASVATGNSIGVMPQSVLDLMQRPDGTKTYQLGPVDTLLVRRKDSRSPIFNAFLDVLTKRHSRGSIVERDS